MKCHKHPKYVAQRKPYVSCLSCWMVWLEKNPDASIDGKTLRRILEPLWSQVKATKTTADFTFDKVFLDY